MPSRIVREGINDSRAVNTLSEPAEILYRRLMSVIDDYGRYEADPELIRAKCFARQLDRWPVTRVREALEETARITTDDGKPLILLYRSGSKAYLQFNNFGQRERSKSKFPEPSVRQVLDAQRSDGSLPQPAADCGEPPTSADNSAKAAPAKAGNAEPPPYSYAHSDADADALAVPTIAAAGFEYPETAAAVRQYFPTTDDGFIVEIIHDSMRVYADLTTGKRAPPLSDLILSEAVHTAKFPKQTSAGPFRKDVPRCVQTWAEQAIKQGSIR